MKRTLAIIAVLVVAGPLGAEEKTADGPKTAESAESPQPRRRVYTGRVVMVREALKRRGITSYSEMEGDVALETYDGRLLPIVSDWRGRAFYQDPRLRGRRVELVGHQHEGVPYLQVLMVFLFDAEGRRHYMDYYCDTCAIPMFEIKPCDCCQQPIRLRFQKRGLPDYLEGKERVPIGLPEGGKDALAGKAKPLPAEEPLKEGDGG